MSFQKIYQQILKIYFFAEVDIKHAIKIANKHAAPGPD